MKAQSALEFMTVVGIGLIILAATSLIGADYISSYFNDINIINAKQTVSNIVSASSLVYSQGIGGQTRVSLNIPRNIVRNFTYVSGREVNIRINQGGLQDIFQDTGVNISGTLPLTEGKRYVYLRMVNNSIPGVNQGEIKLLLDDPNYAYIWVESYRYNGSNYVIANNFSDAEDVFYNIKVTDINDTPKYPTVDLKIYSQDGSVIVDEEFNSTNSSTPPYNISALDAGVYVISVRLPEIEAVGTKLFNVYSTVG